MVRTRAQLKESGDVVPELPGVPKKREASVFAAAAKRALGGGLPGAIAMVLQVVLLMWMRTTVNYQMRNGGTMLGVMALLYAEGGVARFYSGFGFALLQGPLSRFGDTAANAGVLAALEGSRVPVLLKTVCASAAAAGWRALITPLDTAKTVLQVEGAAGLEKLGARVAAAGPVVLWAGALGATVATFMGHYPWFATNNALEARLPPAKTAGKKLVRRALIGFASSLVADCCSNSIRVVKTAVQTAAEPVGYFEAAHLIVERDGLGGLLWRGLVAKILCNGVSSILFSVIWKSLMDSMNAKEKKRRAK
mmetsp:Transcript_1022/g.2803  ORF Transcript_1022/g.2803 Transcript_1022/m.2803 type:complete len:308 (-) Transcript_1022:62-985(-)